MATFQETIEEFTDTVRENLAERRERRREQAEKVAERLRKVPYAALGSAAQGVDRGRDAVKRAFEMPSKLVETASSAPEKLGEAFEENADRGHKIVTRVMERDAVKGLSDRFKAVRKRSKSTASSVKATATSARRAARATAEAIEDAAEAVFDPQDSRRYEERTLEELRALASERDIAGRSGMNKGQLIKALRKA